MRNSSSSNNSNINTLIYTGETYEDIKSSDIIILKVNTFPKNDFKAFYGCLFADKKFVNSAFITELEKETDHNLKNIDIDKYLIKKPFNITNLTAHYNNYYTKEKDLKLSKRHLIKDKDINEVNNVNNCNALNTEEDVSNALRLKKLQPYKTTTESKSTLTKTAILNGLFFDEEENFKYSNDFPFKKYSFFIHPSCYLEYEQKSINNSNNQIKLEAIQFIIKILMGKIVDNIRMSDYCVINQIDSNKIPCHIKLINTQFLQDCLVDFKLINYENSKYKPLEYKKR